MSASSGLDTYRTESKDGWRRWQWGEVVRRLEFRGVSPEFATVLYLAGPDDADRREARRRGFLPENLIAVDINRENVRSIEKRNGLAICAPMQDVLEAWPEDWPIDVVLPDTCGIIHGQVKDILWGMMACPSLVEHTVLVVNMVAGHEPSDYVAIMKAANSEHGFPDKRGSWLALEIAMTIAEAYLGTIGKRFTTDAERNEYANVANGCLRWMVPTGYSYKSENARVRMDSLATYWPGACRADGSPNNRVVRQVRALRARRTIRKKKWGRAA